MFYSAVQSKEWLCLDRAEQVFSQGKPGCHDDEASPTGAYWANAKLSAGFLGFHGRK
jgi:hypothetical protein